MEITKLVSKFVHLDAPMPKMELKVAKYMYKVPLKHHILLRLFHLLNFFQLNIVQFYMEITKMVSKFKHLDAPMSKMELKVAKYMYKVPLIHHILARFFHLVNFFQNLSILY